MRKTKTLFIAIAATVFMVVNACKKENNNTTVPPTGTINIYLKDIAGLPLTDANVVIINSDKNEAVASLKTNAGGLVSIANESNMNYSFEISKQGFEQANTLVVGLEVGKTIDKVYNIQPLANTANLGWIEGTASGSGNVMIIAVVNGIAYTTTSNTNGQFYLYNVAEGNAEITALKKGFLGISNAIVVAGQKVAVTVNLNASSKTVVGQISAQAGGNIVTSSSISLIHPIAKKTIPGLSQLMLTGAGSYTFNNVPNIELYVRASYENDLNTVSANYISKNGEPKVIVGSNTWVPIVITEAIAILAPVRTPDNTNNIEPVEINTLTPTFKWNKSQNEGAYVFELQDANGKIIAGGMELNPNESTTSPVQFGAIFEWTYGSSHSGTANTLPALENGKTYKFKIYGKVKGLFETQSEDQRGLFKIKL